MVSTFGSDAFSAPVDQDTMLILRDGAWIGLRDSLAVSGVTLCVLLLVRLFGGESLGVVGQVPAESPPDEQTA